MIKKIEKLTCRCSSPNTPIKCIGNCGYICQRIPQKQKTIYNEIDSVYYVDDEK